jgi:hypothetical protein
MFVMTVILCSAMGFDCKETVVHQYDTQEQCIFDASYKTRTFLVKELFLLNSFQEVNCSNKVGE